MKKCLGFWDANSEICDWEDEAGTKPILEIKMRKTFPCVPVSKLKEVINRLERMETADILGNQEWVVSVKDLKKKLGLSDSLSFMKESLGKEK